MLFCCAVCGLSDLEERKRAKMRKRFRYGIKENLSLFALKINAFQRDFGFSIKVTNGAADFY